MTTNEPQRRDVGTAWASHDAACGWLKGAAARNQALEIVTELMLDMAGVVVGSRVLDLGAGTGDQSLIAAQRVGPGGSVLATDVSAAMLDLARATADAASVHNVETRVMDAQQLDLASDSFDAAIARFSLQFVPDLQRALAEVRRVLKPGGRFAAVVFSSVERNPFRAAPQAIASRMAGRPFPAPGPGQWALNDPATLLAAFRQAGFLEVEVRPAPMAYRFTSLDDALRNLEESQPPLMQLLATLSESDRTRTWAEIRQTLQSFAGPDGFEAPSEGLIASGLA
jgi:SAM-dependent methyltransferase